MEAPTTDTDNAIPVELTSRGPRLWKPNQVIFTPAALDEAFGQSILDRVEALGIEVIRAKSNRLPNLRGADERATYRNAKRTMAVVVAPPSALKLTPIPPSADYQFHLAEGCPGHCQYCYLAGSLAGPPVIRVFANLPTILANVSNYIKPGPATTSFECSCYTDPLALEHLTGSLSTAIEHVGTLDNAHLRWTTKYDNVGPLLGLAHNGRTRIRFSVNALGVTERFEGGTSDLAARLAAARRVAQAGYPLGFVIGPIMTLDQWTDQYETLFQKIEESVGDLDCDLTFELITHRFTPGSKETLLGWYPQTKLEMDESTRSVKTNKFGGRKYVYPKPTMNEMRAWFTERIDRLPSGRILYWT